MEYDSSPIQAALGNLRQELYARVKENTSHVVDNQVYHQVELQVDDAAVNDTIRGDMLDGGHMPPR